MDFHNLVAGWNDRDLGTAIDRHTRMAKCSEHRGVGIIEALARLQYSFTGRGFAGPRVNELRLFNWPVVRNESAIACDVLDHDHRVGTAGKGSASHDFDGLPRIDFAWKDRAGADLANDFERARKVRRADRKAVADRTRQRRRIAVGMNRLGRAPAGGGGGGWGFW